MDTLLKSELNTSWGLVMSIPPYSLFISSSSSAMESSNASHWMVRSTSSVSLETESQTDRNVLISDIEVINVKSVPQFGEQVQQLQP